MEQPLPPEGSCLLGSMNLVKYIDDENYSFNFQKFQHDVKIFTRLLDNVVELNGLPLEGQRKELLEKRRHGMGFTGLGSTLNLLGMEYGSQESILFTSNVMRTLAIAGYQTGIELAKEKGCAPLLKNKKNRQAWIDSSYMKKIWEHAPDLKLLAKKYGCRFTHHSSIAPTGTISFSVNNNVSNGIEPTFSHEYTRNVIIPGRKSKKAVPVYSYEFLIWKHSLGDLSVPKSWRTTDNISPEAHIDIQAAAQKWCDSSISKTINVPTSMSFEDFKDIYLYAWKSGLKGCTTFRFNPDVFGGVLVKNNDLENTEYRFTLENGNSIICKGNDIIEYDGEEHTAQNLADAIREGYYGKL